MPASATSRTRAHARLPPRWRPTLPSSSCWYCPWQAVCSSIVRERRGRLTDCRPPRRLSAPLAPRMRWAAPTAVAAEPPARANASTAPAHLRTSKLAGLLLTFPPRRTPHTPPAMPRTIRARSCWATTSGISRPTTSSRRGWHATRRQRTRPRSQQHQRAQQASATVSFSGAAVAAVGKVMKMKVALSSAVGLGPAWPVLRPVPRPGVRGQCTRSARGQCTRPWC